MAEISSWYHTREEIEKNSPSRLDGINFKEETFQRWSYTSFLQELGQRLNSPQRSIATAIVLCQRFFTRQSLAKNDPKIVATICMFIAGKVEGYPRPACDVLVVSYKVLYNIKPLKDVFERLKVTVLTGEKLVLSTLGCDLDIEHPYPLVMDWIKKSVKAEDFRRLCQAAFNFVNNTLRTSLCLQFRPCQIAAASIYLGLSMCKMKLPCDGDKAWFQEFGITKRQLAEICDQTLDLYVQDFVIPRGDCKQIKIDETRSSQALQGHQDDKVNCQT
ncbi:PREDICTED: putative cyclin-T1-1 [Camelina sativa]|uniref:Cyclin-T1-1 n=1 Tax=Camelina sativa TaxID=90675 RepID=A0ABM0X597_CAMSA|nr:PREDICTED: putative cyclin-T1-1 [Camelina sativa]